MRVISLLSSIRPNASVSTPFARKTIQSARKRLYALVVCALVAFGFGTKPALSTDGWQVGIGTIFASADAACKAAFNYYAPTIGFGASPGQYLGTTPMDGWNAIQCNWTGLPYAPATYFNCDDAPFESRVPVSYGEGACIYEGPSRGPQREASCDAIPNPKSDSPINFLSGAKLFEVEDFRSANGSLYLTRRYNSRPYGMEYNMRRVPISLGHLWQFDFYHEIQIDGGFTSNHNVALETAGGGSYTFTRQTSGSMLASGDLPQIDYTMEFVGTFPGYSSVLTTSTQWKVKDPQDRTWLFQTFSYGSYGYIIGHPISVTFRGGLQWTFTYGSYNELTTITDSFGQQISFTWIYADPSTIGATGTPRALAISQATLPDGSKLAYTYEAVNTSLGSYPPYPDRLIKVEQKDSSNNVLDSTSYAYGNTSYPYAVTAVYDNASNQTRSVTYDASGQATQSTGPSGIDSTQVTYPTYSGGSTVSRTVTNALGKDAVYNFTRSIFSWVHDDKLTSVVGTASTHCVASTGSLSYSSNMVSSTTDEEGRVTNYTRDSKGHPTQIVDGYGTGSARTRSFTWHTTFDVPTQIVEPGLTTDLTWNSSGQLTQLTQTDTTTTSSPYSTNGQTRTWAYTYESTGGFLASVDGPLSGTGDTTSYTYTSDGYLQTVTNELSQVTTFTAWNGRGQPTSMTDPNSVVTTFGYDGIGRLTSTTVDPSGIAAATTIDYNTAGLISKITRPNSAYLQYTYDNAHRLSKVQDNTGASIEYDRDNLGGVTARRIKDPSSTLVLSQTATFDELGRLLTFVGASSQTWTHAYDKTNNRVSVTDPRTNVYHWAFDSVNRLIRETNENSAQVNLTLNGKDEVTNYSDPRSLSTSYVRDGFGDIIQRTSPDTGTTDTYNALAKPTQITDGRSIVTNLTYDNAGRLLTKQYPAATGENITYTWDATASGNKGVGRNTKIEDASGSVEWVYDALGRATQEKKTTASIIYTTNYVYDADGKVTQMTYPSGRIVNFSRDSLGRVSGVTTKKDSGSSTVTLASSVAYEPFGLLNGLAYGNGLTLTKTFTQDYLLNTLMVKDVSTSTTVVDRSHAYSDAINLTGITDNITSARNETYVYTAANRLNEGDGLWGTLTWGYDGVGNRTSEVLTSGSTTTSSYSYPTGNNLVSSITQASTTVRSFSYDGGGNMTADTRGSTAYNYRYNKRNRLDRLTIGSTVTADYTYDGLERLAIRTTSNMTPASTTHYVYDLAGHLIAESTDTGTTVREYIWLDDMPLAVVADVDTMTPHLYYVHADHLNRPLKLTDGSEATVWDAVYKPFGEVQSITGTASNNLRFPGQYFLIESGLAYNWHRHYDASLGLYVQPDPLGFVDGPSIVAYARSSPAMYVDPDGRFWWIAPAVLAGGNLAWQLYKNNGNFSCVNWWDVAGWGVMGLGLPVGGVAELLLAVRGGRIAADIGRFLADESGALGATSQAAKRFTPDQAALVDLAKGAKQRGGVTASEAKILNDWGSEYGLSVRGPESHPGGLWEQSHMHVGPIQHIPVK